MQIGSSTNVAMEQLSRSIQSVNELNQAIVDKSQDLSGKMLKVAVAEKVQAEADKQKVDLLA